MDVLVLREGVHGMPASDYVERLTARLDDHTITHARTPSEERRLIADATVATGPRLAPELLADAEELELFACSYAGTDHLPLAALAEADVAVTNATGVHAPNVAEHAVGALLAFSRGFHTAARRESWQPLSPGELAGSTAVIVGLGAIGEAIATRLAAFDVTTIGVRRHPESGGPTDEVVGPDALHDGLARADHVVLCCPLTPETRGLIGEDELRTLSPASVLVNVARGEVVDTDALLSALQRGQLAGAALDVTDPEPLPASHPLWTHDEVLVTPHSAGATPQYYDRLADIVAENVERLAAGEPLRNRVEVPDQ